MKLAIYQKTDHCESEESCAQAREVSAGACADFLILTKLLAFPRRDHRP